MSHIFEETLYPSRGPQGFCKGCTWMQVLSTADIARFVKVFQPAAFRSSPCFSIWSEETFWGGTHLDAHQTSKRCSRSAGRAPAWVIATWISRPCWYLTAPCRQIALEVIGTPIVWELWGQDRYLTSNLYWLSRPGSIALIDWNDMAHFQWGDKKSDTIWNPFQIQTCGLPKANFQWLTRRGKEAQVNLPVFPAIKRQGRPLDQPLLFFCAPSKTAGGNVHLDRTPTSSSSSSFSWHQLQWVRVFVFLRLGIITMWCCHNPSSSQRHWYLFWFSCWIAPCYCSSLTLTIQTNYNTYFHLLIYLLTKYVV